MNLKHLGTFFGNLLHNNNFLKILSVFLALFVWIYILYIVNPVNETVFDKVEVNLAYEGSVPERNGYMYLMADPNLTVNVTVSGSRSELIRLSKDQIKATLNMDSVISEGTYNINVSVSTGNRNLTVTEVYPQSFTIEFAEKSTREIPLQILTSGTLPTGYEIGEQTVSPQTVTVTGPKKTVETIGKAYVTVPLTNVKESVSGAYDIALVNEAGENVDRRFLTLSDASAEALTNVHYRKTLPTAVEIVNPHGLFHEDTLFSVSLSVPEIKATGSEKTLSSMDELTVGTIDTSKITKSGTVTLKMPVIEGVIFDTQEIVATVTLNKNLTTKTLTFSTADLTCINVPSGKVAKIDASSVSVKIRGTSDTLRKLTKETLKCQLDISEANDDGTYSLLVTPTAAVSDLAFDVIGEYNLKATVQ